MPKNRKNFPGEAVLQTNKLYQTLRCLDGQEIKRLTKFLASSYFNQSKTLAKLCELLLECCERKEAGFNRFEIWDRLFPGDSYDDVNFRKYNSDLLKLVQDFMAQETVMYDTVRRNIDALDFAVRRKIEPVLTGMMRQVRVGLDNNQYRSLE